MLLVIYLLLALWAVAFLFCCKTKPKRVINEADENNLDKPHDDYEHNDTMAIDYNPSTGMPMTRCGAITSGVDVSGKSYGEI